VAKADFSYEVRKIATDPVWVEDYVVRTSDGESVGTVATVLERAGERLLVVERGLVPVAQDRRVVPWSDVETVDHDALAVWLRLREPEFLENALELDPGRAVEEGAAEATRLCEAPADEVPAPQVAPGGPVDRPTTTAAIVVAGLAAFSALVVAVVVSATESATAFVLALVPAALAVAAVVLGYRAYRSPYAARGARKP
jgi:hypothetical protein